MASLKSNLTTCSLITVYQTATRVSIQQLGFVCEHSIGASSSSYRKVGSSNWDPNDHARIRPISTRRSQLYMLSHIASPVSKNGSTLRNAVRPLCRNNNVPGCRNSDMASPQRRQSITDASVLIWRPFTLYRTSNFSISSALQNSCHRRSNKSVHDIRVGSSKGEPTVSETLIRVVTLSVVCVHSFVAIGLTVSEFLVLQTDRQTDSRLLFI